MNGVVAYFAEWFQEAIIVEIAKCNDGKMWNALCGGKCSAKAMCEDDCA